MKIPAFFTVIASICLASVPGQAQTVLPSALVEAQTIITSYEDGFSTVQGQNGWSYLYAPAANRNNDPATLNKMNLASGERWYYGNANGDRAQINANSFFQNAGFDPQIVYTFDQSYSVVSIDLNGLTVNENGQGYVGYWNAGTGTWTHLLTLNGGTTYGQSIIVSDVSVGDAIIFGKRAGYGSNYGAITNFSPVITSIPESGSASLALGMLGVAFVVIMRCKRSNG